MTVFETRSISMILMVPDIETTANLSLSNVDQNQSLNINVSSMPVYHGSIVRIERHKDNKNLSDLVIHIPNVHNVSSLSNEIPLHHQKRVKRRAPICPIVNNPNQTTIPNSNRLATGLRSLSRALTYNSKSKPLLNLNRKASSSILPDVEVMKENLPIKIKCKTMTTKDQYLLSSIPKLNTPSISCIKSKGVNVEKPESIQTTPRSTIITTKYSDKKDINSTDTKHTTLKEPSNNLDGNNIDDDDDDDDDDDSKQKTSHSMELVYEVEQQFAAISKLISDAPKSSIDSDSLSTHRYSSISVLVPDSRTSNKDQTTKPMSATEQSSTKINRPFRIQTSLLQPDISVVRVGIDNLMTGTDHILPGETFSLEQKQCSDTSSNDETLFQCYEVSYEIDSNFPIGTQNLENSSLIPNELDIDPLTYKQLLLKRQNIYEQIQTDNIISQCLEKCVQFVVNHDSVNENTRNESRSFEDLSPINTKQLSIDQQQLVNNSNYSEIIPRKCSIQRSDSVKCLSTSVDTDLKECHEHFIQSAEGNSSADQAHLKEKDSILCINDTSIIDEDYTIVVEMIKNGFETNDSDFHVITNDVYEEFKSQVNQKE